MAPPTGPKAGAGRGPHATSARPSQLAGETLIKLAEAARLLGLTRTRVNQLVHEGKLDWAWRGEKYWTSVEAIGRHLEQETARKLGELPPPLPPVREEQDRRRRAEAATAKLELLARRRRRPRQ